MAQFIIESGHVICPACNLALTKIGEQDGRVAIMRHEGSALCSMRAHQYRVDRTNGNAEEYHEA